jgi:GTP-binding protein EngB required for normal cell division
MHTSINDRVTIDFSSLCDDAEDIINSINVLRSEKLFDKILGSDFSRNLKDHCSLIKKRLYGTFNIVIAGDFKRGKSTLINAIIGEDVAPASVTPETVTINKFSFSETPSAEAILKNGKKASLSYNELNRNAIEKIAGQLPSEIDFIDIKSNTEILRDISIVDTPGIGDLLKAFDQQVTDYLVSADALIYVISARSPLSVPEQVFISSSILPQSFSQIFVVVNMADTLETIENINKIYILTTEKLKSINPDISIFMLSALDELCRKKDLARPEPVLSDLMENNFLEFETALQNDIILQRELIKSTRVATLLGKLIDEIENTVILINKSVSVTSKQHAVNELDLVRQNEALLAYVENEKKEIAHCVDVMNVEAKKWLQDFLARLKNELDSLRTNAKVADLERHFQFYMSDLIKNAITSCVKQHQEEISNRLQNFSKNISTEITKNTFGYVDVKVADVITDISWTGIEIAMSSIDFLGIIFGPVMLIGQAIAGFIRQGIVTKKKADFLAPLLQEYSTFVTETAANLDEVYEQLKLSAIDKIEEVYDTQIKISTGAIKQAQRIISDDKIKSEQVVEYLDSLLSTINENRAVLNKYNIIRHGDGSSCKGYFGSFHS